MAISILGLLDIKVFKRIRLELRFGVKNFVKNKYNLKFLLYHG
jgi:hypothetical protein